MVKSEKGIPWVRGKITVLSTIRGARRQVDEIRFATSPCCGSRLDVGSVYALVTSNPQPVMVVNSGNLIELGKDFTREKILKDLDAVTSETKDVDEVFPRWVRDRLDQQPVQPPCREYTENENRTAR